MQKKIEKEEKKKQEKNGGKKGILLLPSLKFIQDELDDEAAKSEQFSEMGNPNFIAEEEFNDNATYDTEASHLQDNVTVSSYVSSGTKKSNKSKSSKSSRSSKSSKKSKKSRRSSKGSSRPTSAESHASSVNSSKSSIKSSLPPESVDGNDEVDESKKNPET